MRKGSAALAEGLQIMGAHENDDSSKNDPPSPDDHGPKHIMREKEGAGMEGRGEVAVHQSLPHSRQRTIKLDRKYATQQQNRT
jgi:hypothetical protein